MIAAAITFMFLNLDSLYRPVANCSLVPQADIGDRVERPFAGTVKTVKADTQISVSLSVAWPTSVRFSETLTTDCLLVVQSGKDGCV